MLVLGIETSTPHTSVALGTETGVIGSALLGTGPGSHEAVIPMIDQLLTWTDLKLGSLAGIAVGIGPGLFTGMRVGVATARTLAQVLGIPVVGMASLDVLAFPARYSSAVICAAIDAKRGEVFFAFYRPVPGGVTRETDFEVGSPARLTAELQARRESVLVVGNGGLVYRRQLREAGSHVELATTTMALPSAAAVVELAVPRFEREEFDRVYDLKPLYIRKSDAEIAWDRRRTG
ncbi:MAG: tRNA (adenosine(37)-N6)-threonylcarbamoyltransferase complex dimerization subunit type 1 TsaB [Actinomycetota bacterium]